MPPHEVLTFGIGESHVFVRATPASVHDRLQGGREMKDETDQFIDVIGEGNVWSFQCPLVWIFQIQRTTSH